MVGLSYSSLGMWGEGCVTSSQAVVGMVPIAGAARETGPGLEGYGGGEALEEGVGGVLIVSKSPGRNRRA